MVIYSNILVDIVTMLTLGVLQVRGFTLFPFVVISKDYKDNKELLNHERIHLEQQKELLVVGFFILYYLNIFLLFLKYWDTQKAYKECIFEKEAYDNAANPEYINTRKWYACFKS